MKSSAAHMIIKALTLGGLSEPYLPPVSSPICHSCGQSLMRIGICYIVLWKATIVLHKEGENFFWVGGCSVNIPKAHLSVAVNHT